MKRTIAMGLVVLMLAADTGADDPNKEPALPVQRTVLAKRLDVSSGERHALTVYVSSQARGREPYLFFKAAAQSDKAAGYCNRAIRVLVNGTPIDTERLSNRPATATMMNGHIPSTGIFTTASENSIPTGPSRAGSIIIAFSTRTSRTKIALLRTGPLTQAAARSLTGEDATAT